MTLKAVLTLQQTSGPRRHQAGPWTNGARRSLLSLSAARGLPNRRDQAVRRQPASGQIEDENRPRLAAVTLAYLRNAMNRHARRSDEFRSPIVRG